MQAEFSHMTHVIDSTQGNISPSFRRGYISTSLGLQRRKRQLRHASSLAWNGHGEFERQCVNQNKAG